MQGLVISGLYGNEWEILPVVDAVYSCGVDDLQKFSVTLPFRWSDDHAKPKRIRIDGILATEAESMQETPTGCVISGSCIDFEAINATEYEKEDITGTTFAAICSSLASEAGITITGASNTDIDRGGIEPGTALALLTDWADIIDKKQVTHYTNTTGDILKVGSAISSSNSVPAVIEWEGSHQEESYNSCTVTKISTVSEDKELVVSRVLDAREDKSQDPQMVQTYKVDFATTENWDLMWNTTEYFFSCNRFANYAVRHDMYNPNLYIVSMTQSYNSNSYLVAPFTFVDSYEKTFEIIYRIVVPDQFGNANVSNSTGIGYHHPSYRKYPDDPNSPVIPEETLTYHSNIGIKFTVTGFRYFEPKRDPSTIIRIPFHIPNVKLPEHGWPPYLYVVNGVVVRDNSVQPAENKVEYPTAYTDFVSHLSVPFPASVFVCDGFIPKEIKWEFVELGYVGASSDRIIPSLEYLQALYGYTGDTIYLNNNVNPPNIVHDAAWYYYWHLHRDIVSMSDPIIATVFLDENMEKLASPYIAFGCKVTTSKPILNEHCSTYQRYDADDARTACLGPYNDSSEHFMGLGGGNPSFGIVIDAKARNSWNCKWVDIPEVNADYNWDELSLINAQHYASIFALGMYGTQAIDLSNSNTDTSLTRAQGSTPMRVYATTPNAETYEWGDTRAGSKPLNISSALFAHKGDRTDSEERRKYYNAKEEEYSLTFTVPLSYFPTWASLFSMSFQNQTPVKISVSLLSETVTYYCQYASQGGFTLQ